jgi:Rod binding domain-containing protein
MSQTISIPMRNAQAAYVEAGRAKTGSREAKAFQAAQGFESIFFQNMLENMVSGLGADGPLGAGQAGGGAWRGFLLDEMGKGMAKTAGAGLGIAPQVYREMMRLQEKGA